MLATHRDQENVVHSHHHTTVKQQPKTPGTRFSKTPGNFGRNDENAPITFAGKAGPTGTVRNKDNGDTVKGGTISQRQALMTPMEDRSRAPLGNKTTNAKAKTSQSVGAKGLVKDLGKTQARQTVAPKPRHRRAGSNVLKLNTQTFAPDSLDNLSIQEPEYAPPQPKSLPYESDVLPREGLTFNGLKQENLLKGFYQHFHNPIDENGVSRMDKKFRDEMDALLRKVEDQNARELAAFSWHPEDVAENATSNALDNKKVAANVDKFGTSTKINAPTSHQRPPTLSARRAASALAVNTGRQCSKDIRTKSAFPATTRPLSSIISGTKPAKTVLTRPDSTGDGKSTGEAASRTTLGYNKGRSASSLIHSRGAARADRQHQIPKKPTTGGLFRANPNAGPNNPSQSALPAAQISQSPRPTFMSIFDEVSFDEVSDEELMPSSTPFSASDQEEDDFELKLTI